MLFFFVFLAKQALCNLQQLHHHPVKSNKQTLLTDLERKAAAKGLKIVDNDGKGNCLFSALRHQLENKKRKRYYSEMELRTDLVQYLEDHPTFVCIQMRINLFNFTDNRPLKQVIISDLLCALILWLKERVIYMRSVLVFKHFVLFNGLQNESYTFVACLFHTSSLS